MNKCERHIPVRHGGRGVGSGHPAHVVEPRAEIVHVIVTQAHDKTVETGDLTLEITPLSEIRTRNHTSAWAPFRQRLRPHKSRLQAPNGDLHTPSEILIKIILRSILTSENNDLITGLIIYGPVRRHKNHTTC